MPTRKRSRGERNALVAADKRRDQVYQLQQEINHLRAELATVKEWLEDERSDRRAAEERADDLDAQLDEAKGTIVELQQAAEDHRR